MLGWAAVVTVPAVPALPTVNDEAVPVNPVPAPLNDEPVTVPVTEILLLNPIDKLQLAALSTGYLLVVAVPVAPGGIIPMAVAEARIVRVPEQLFII
jgi:hypothetical protein